MKLYRIVPDYNGIFYSKKALANSGITTEDIFYKLGCINVSKHSPYFMITTDPLLISSEKNSLYDNDEEGIFFFTSLQDCFFCMQAINFSDFFCARGVRIFEYDVPEEIVNVSYQGNGYYYEQPIQEVKIPLRLLSDNKKIYDKLTPELEERFKKVADEIDEESSRMLEKVYKKEQLRHPLEIINSDKIRMWIYNTRLKNIGIFFPSDYITGNTFYLTEKELEEMCEQIGISTIDYDGISEHFNEIANLQSFEQNNQRKI